MGVEGEERKKRKKERETETDTEPHNTHTPPFFSTSVMFLMVHGTLMIVFW